MPQLKIPGHEKVAQAVARGTSKSQAWIDAGYKHKSLASKVTAKPAFNARVAEIRAELDAKSSDVTVHNRHFLDRKLGQILDRCMQIAPVFMKRDERKERECEACGGIIAEYTFDAKNALSAVHLLGLEQGMFKRSLDVTSRKATMIEGSQKDILEKFAQLLEKLGIGAMSQLFTRIGHDNLVAAMNLIGYEVAKANGHDVERIGTASGDLGDAGDSGEPDAQCLRAEPEAAPLS